MEGFMRKREKEKLVTHAYAAYPSMLARLRRVEAFLQT